MSKSRRQPITVKFILTALLKVAVFVPIIVFASIYCFFQELPGKRRKGEV